MINKIKSIVVLISFALGTVLPIHISSSQTMVTPQDFQELAPSDKLEEIAVLTIKKLFYYYAQNDLGSFMKLVSENYADTRGMRFEDLPLSFQNDHDILSNIKLELVGVDKVTIHRGVPIKVEVQYRWRSVLTDRDTGVQIKADNNTSVGVVEIGPVEGKIKTASVSNQHFSFFSEAFAGQATKEAEKYLNPKDVKKNADAEKLPKVEPVHGEGRLDFIQRLGLRGHVNSDGTNYYQDDAGNVFSGEDVEAAFKKSEAEAQKPITITPQHEIGPPASSDSAQGLSEEDKANLQSEFVKGTHERQTGGEDTFYAQLESEYQKSKGKQEKEGEAATELTATVSGMYTNASPTGTNANSPVCQTNTAAGKDSISLYNVSVSNNIANNQSSPNVSGNRGQFNFVNVVLTHVAAIEGNILMIGSGSITGTSGDFTRTGVIIIVTPFGASVLGGFTVNADGTITIFLGAGGCLFQKSTVSMSLSEFQRIITDDGIVFQGVNQTGAFLVRTNDVFTVDQQSTRTRLALHVDRVENGVATFSYQIFEY